MRTRRAPASPWAAHTRPYASPTKKTNGSGVGFRLVQLPSQRLDLVAQLGRVLEAEIIGRGEHLLLQLDDRAADLLGGHALGLTAAAAAAGGHLRLRHQEVGDVRDPLLDRR